MDTDSLPTLYFTTQGLWFRFLLDTSIQNNLIDPCFMLFITPDEYNSEVELNDENPLVPLCILRSNIMSYLGRKQTKCKDGKYRKIENIKFTFETDNGTYTEIFGIDRSLCTHYDRKKPFVGVLGTNFLSKYKWVIDFSKENI